MSLSLHAGCLQKHAAMQLQTSASILGTEPWWVQEVYGGDEAGQAAWGVQEAEAALLPLLMAGAFEN